ncbi:chromatin assembly factor 1 subunit A-domain-containing protein [Gilbertella persicaria]|uniref:chromatin assembly factor 1 subunit A-domain-containing protein n=1 Tax=Gilbertella persicaria TaxID=101096 RepID=UPI0022201697|nr:chromatin assembly factor 1 subunit A-domain-containing protein [Gilbertella persicaria]KAI8098081.1 chromatin assembly factor 1 subunit A-domain-containing protein [Gilbertella persicaria]
MQSQYGSKEKGRPFIKNGHIVYYEDRIRIENHPQVNQVIVQFREWRALWESTHTDVALSDIPQEYKDLIAMLAHESDQDLDTLATYLNDLLSPFQRNPQVSHAFLEVIKQTIHQMNYQERYGLASSALSFEGAPSQVPKRLSLYRWQAYTLTSLPTEIQTMVNQQREKRRQFAKELTLAYQRLPIQQRLDVLFDDHSQWIDQQDPLFSSFQYNPHVSIPVRQVRKRLCSSFDTLFYVGLNDSVNLKQRFLDELSASAKQKRGIKIKVNLRKVLDHGVLNKHVKMKLLQFHEDVRPAYYGTWTKSHQHVTGRKPFAKDTDALDYDIDSEAEWDHDVDDEDIDTLATDEDRLFFDSTDDEEEEDEEEEIHASRTGTMAEDTKWLVPEGYLSQDEEMPKKKSRIVSRPAKWPIAGNKHFPMKPVILGPSFASHHEPKNHPLSDFQLHLYKPIQEGYAPFDTSSASTIPETVIEAESSNSPLTMCFELNKTKPPLFQREIDKIVQTNKQELIDIISEHKTKTMMGLVGVLKSNKMFEEYTTAQLQAMIYDVAIQQMHGTHKEYIWCLRNE